MVTANRKKKITASLKKAVKARPRNPNVPTLLVLQRLLVAVSAEYPQDRTSPGIIVSKIKSGEFYVSVCRYAESFGEGKTVVVNGRGATLDAALRTVAAAWLKIGSAKQSLALALEDDELGNEGDDFDLFNRWDGK